MLQKLEIHGVHKHNDQNLRKYIIKKIGKIDRYISRHSRDSARAEIRLSESKTKDDNHCTVQVTLHLPQQKIIIKESALNMFAAIDIVEVKLKQRLKKYKDLHTSGKTRRHLFGRFRRQTAF